MENKIEEVMHSTLANLKSMIDDTTIVGSPIKYDDCTIVPVSKVSLGFVTGGGEYDSKKMRTPTFPFAGGSGGGCNITPVGFLVISKSITRFIRTNVDTNIEKIIDIASSFIKK